MLCFILEPPVTATETRTLPPGRANRLRVMAAAILLSLVLLGSAGWSAMHERPERNLGLNTSTLSMETHVLPVNLVDREREAATAMHCDARADGT